MVDLALELRGRSVGGEATPGQDLLTKCGVIGCLIIGEGVVGSLGVSGEEWSDIVGPVSYWPAFLRNHV